MALLFLDNTVLINFAILDRLDLLEDLLHGDGRWCYTVSIECANSAAWYGALADVPDILGKPLEPSPAERVAARILRDAMAKPGDEAHKHYGEAETLAIIAERGMEAVLLTDDAGARDFARARGVPPIDTWRLLAVLEQRGRISAGDRHTFESKLHASGRRPPRA